MLTDSARFDEYLGILKNRVNQASLELSESADQVAPLGFRENAFTAVALETLEDLGQLQNAELCYLHRRFGRAIGKCNAWCVEEDTGQLNIVTTIFKGTAPPGHVNARDLETAAARAARVVLAARTVQHEGNGAGVSDLRHDAEVPRTPRGGWSLPGGSDNRRDCGEAAVSESRHRRT